MFEHSAYSVESSMLRCAASAPASVKTQGGNIDANTFAIPLAHSGDIKQIAGLGLGVFRIDPEVNLRESGGLGFGHRRRELDAPCEVATRVERDGVALARIWTI